MSAAQEFMNECTALEIEIIKLKSEKRDLLKACTMMVDYANATIDDDDILDLMYANAIAGIKAAVKGEAA